MFWTMLLVERLRWAIAGERIVFVAELCLANSVMTLNSSLNFSTCLLKVWLAMMYLM